MKVIALSVTFILSLACTSHAQDPAVGIYELKAIEVESETHGQLLTFCIEALLFERGLATSPFAGSTDKWILESLTSDPDFTNVLDESKGVEDLVLGSGVGDGATDKNPKTARAWPMHAEEKEGRLLAKKLNAHQKSLLPYVYLYREGLVAVSRPEFKSLFENPEKHEEVRHLVSQAWTDKAAKVHRSLFAASDRSVAPLLELELRRVSFKLECDIVGRLSEVERERLLDIVSSNPKLHFKITRGMP